MKRPPRQKTYRAASSQIQPITLQGHPPQQHSRRARTARATGRRGLADLLELYQGINGFQANTLGFSDYKTTYGEVTEQGILALSQQFSARAPLSALPASRRVFYDLGCGIGRAVVGLAILHPELQAKGIEIVPDRIRFAREALNRIKHKQVAARIQIQQGNFLEPALSLRDASWVFVSNLLFDDATQRQLYEKMVSELPVGAIVICCNELAATAAPNSRLERVATDIPVPMTWSITSTCHVYRAR